MAYRAYCDALKSQPLSAFEKAHALYKEFIDLDDALDWARHVTQQGAVAVAIDGDDGTQLSKQEIAAAVWHRDRELAPRNEESAK